MVLSNQQKRVAYESCNCWIKKLSEVEKAYDVFKHAGENHALKVIIENDISK